MSRSVGKDIKARRARELMGHGSPLRARAGAAAAPVAEVGDAIPSGEQRDDPARAFDDTHQCSCDEQAGNEDGTQVAHTVEVKQLIGEVPEELDL
jgi:hypothetical protein